MNYQDQNISELNFEQCTKCTICTAYCPVIPIKPEYPGPKQAGPDSMRYRLKDPEFFDTAYKYCLNCKRCEVACPSDVKIGDLILAARIELTKERPSLRDTMLAETDVVGSLATIAAPIVNATLSRPVVKSAMDKIIGVDHRRNFPAYSGQKFTTWFKRHAQKQQDDFDRKVSYFHGCYVNYNHPALGKALVKLMNAAGYGITLLEKERCCGVAKIANRLVKEARRDAKINIESIRLAGETIATSSTCCLTIRNEYPDLLKAEFPDNSLSDMLLQNVSLATAFIHRHIESGDIKLVFRNDYRCKVAYHTACHMEKLGMSVYSIAMLKMIPGLQLTVLDSNCCGIAGTYGFKKENYETSQAIGRKLFDQIKEENPDFVVTDCETCKWQIEMSTPFKVKNPIEILAEALDVEATRKANTKQPH